MLFTMSPPAGRQPQHCRRRLPPHLGTQPNSPAAICSRMEETNFRELLQAIETTLFDVQDVDPAAFLQALQRAKPAFLNLLRYKACAVALYAVPLAPQPTPVCYML